MDSKASDSVATKILHVLSVAIIALTIVTAGVGVFYRTNGYPFDFINQYGDNVKIYGSGLYAQDSFFKAPIFRGTDFAMLFVACPLLAIALYRDVVKKSIKTRLQLVSLISCFLYYASSIAFGVVYNFLLLVYIFLLAACFFGLIMGIRSIPLHAVEQSIQKKWPYRGSAAFMFFTGIALLAVWMPDIITAMAQHRALALIENYTTEITYVLDMGIIAPSCFVSLYLIKKRNGFGFVLLDMLLTLCIVIGIILPVQTYFQVQAGIELPFAAIISKIVSFCLLALFAFYFKLRLMKAMNDHLIH